MLLDWGRTNKMTGYGLSLLDAIRKFNKGEIDRRRVRPLLKSAGHILLKSGGRSRRVSWSYFNAMVFCPIFERDPF